jgi:GNAT superfamily N-acetyltransferase
MSHVANDGYRVRPFADMAEDAGAAAAIDAIFFETSNTKTFADEAARAAFRERWLGRYLTNFASCAFLAVDGGGQVVGYIVGSLDDPLRDPIFADLDHLKAFRDVIARYPAQLHINLTEGCRGRGIGRLLVGAFVDLAAKRRLPGVHAVTSRGARNVRFYAANGFVEQASARAGADTELVFLGRDLMG